MLGSFFRIGLRAMALGGFGLATACGGGDDAPPGPPADSGAIDSTVGDSTSDLGSDVGTDATADDADATVDSTDTASEDTPPDAVRDSGPPCPDGGCGAGLTCCAGACVDTTKDPLNCGACSRACTLTQFCSGTKCSEAVFANVCDNPNATVVKDPYDPDNAAGHTLGATLAATCVPPTTVAEVDQDAGGVLEFSGRPLAGGGTTYVTGGGSFGQHVIDYMDKAALTPIYLTGDGVTLLFHDRRTGAIVATVPYTDVNDGHDFFFAELAVEPVSGTLCFSAQGMFGGGTAAAAYWIASEMIPKRATYTDAWYAYEWTDDGDKLPNATDTFRLIAHGR